MVAFYCRITRLYLEKYPAAFERCLKPNLEFLMFQLQVAKEILSEELVATVQLMVTKTDCLGFFIGLFMKVTHKMVLQQASDQEVYLEPNVVNASSSQYCTNIANVMSYILTTTKTNIDVRNNLIGEKVLSMQFFPILLAAVFRATLCNGYLPLFYTLMDSQRTLFKASHMNAIDSQVERVARIIRYATLNSQGQSFGMVRYHALRVLIPLIRFEHATINSQVYTSSILPLLFVLMFDTYPHSTLIHRVIVDIFSEIMIKTRRNKSQSIFSFLAGENHEQLISLLTIISTRIYEREFGIAKEISYLEPARTIFNLFDDVSRIREVIRADPDLATKWKAISKASKTYSVNVEKAQAKTQKLVVQARKLKAASDSEDIDNEFAVVSKLKTMENADSDDITDLSFLKLKRAFRSMSMQ